MTNRKAGRGTSAIRRTVITAVFAALAYALMLVFHFKVQFLTFDLKDAVITIAGLLLGPVAALVISLLVAVLELTVSDTGIYGFIMNFASSATFSVVASLVYQYRKRLAGAILGLISAVLALVAVMMALNLVVTPFFMGVSAHDVAAMIPTLFLPFNAVKALANAALVLILYKPVSRAMVAARLLPHPAPPVGASAAPRRPLWYSIAVTLGGLVVLIVAFLVFFLLLKGDMSLFS